MKKGRIATAVVAIAALLLALPMVRARAATATFVDIPGNPIHVVGTQQIDTRQYNVKVTSPALGTNHVLDIRVLLRPSQVV